MTLVAFALLASQAQASPLSAALTTPHPHVLVFTKTGGFRHDSIPVAVEALRTLSKTKGFSIEHTEDASVFARRSLDRFDAVMFLSTTGDVLNGDQEEALYGWVRDGGGFMGVHAAADTEYDWPRYLELVGAYFKRHPEIQEAAVNVEDPCHPSSHLMPKRWVRTDEWYDYKANPRGSVRVLMSLDPKSYRGSEMADDHPITWCGQVGSGRTWYTGFGHTKESYAEPLFLESLAQAIVWTSQKLSPKGRVEPQWRSTKGWQTGVDSLTNPSGQADHLVSKEAFGDALIHAEFKIPKGSNSGIYVQGRYEIQIFDSFGKDKKDLTFADAGGIYQRWKDDKGFEGRAADHNVIRPPGEWNTYDILFRAPRFAGGKKTENARFVEVRVNGIVVHRNVELTGPTRAPLFEDERPTGPLMLQGDHGPIVYRNVWVLPQRLP